ncbi:MAG: V4R domain-containing protein [Acidobacteriota bacterium]
MKDDLSHLTSASIDSLPFGYIALSPDGTIRKYNRYEADMARKDPAEVLGKNFFRDVAPCTQVRDFEGRFREFVAGELGEESTLSFEFVFAFRHGEQRVRIGFVRSPLEQEVIVTVNRLRNRGLAEEPELEHRSFEGRWIDASGQAVTAVGPDFWLALDRLHGNLPGADRRLLARQLGRSWGASYIQRVEAFVQRTHGKTLREVEIHVALEALSGAVGLVGLGRFEVELGYRNRGLVVVAHRNSPLAETPSEHDGPRCDLLAGLHAGFLEHLSGRSLEGREIHCSASPDQPCVFVIGTASRLAKLLRAEAGSADADLMAALVGAGAAAGAAAAASTGLEEVAHG